MTEGCFPRVAGTTAGNPEEGAAAALQPRTPFPSEPIFRPINNTLSPKTFPFDLRATALYLSEPNKIRLPDRA